MRTLAILTVAALLLAACETTPPEPRVETRIVPVPVRVACVPKDTPASPSSYADDKLPEGQDAAADRYRLRAQANEQRRARLAQIEPIIKACRP